RSRDAGWDAGAEREAHRTGPSRRPLSPLSGLAILPVPAENRTALETNALCGPLDRFATLTIFNNARVKIRPSGPLLRHGGPFDEDACFEQYEASRTARRLGPIGRLTEIFALAW